MDKLIGLCLFFGALLMVLYVMAISIVFDMTALDKCEEKYSRDTCITTYR